jgi:hypothetical protein
MTEMFSIDNLINKLIELDIAKPDEILGCTPEEILELQQHQGIAFLPELYREFLEKMGKGAGLFLQHLECFYPELLHLKDEVKTELLHLKDEVKTELLQPDLTTFKLPDDAFVYMTNQGYEFFYFLTHNQDDDPTIYHYIEGNGSTLNVQPFIQWDHLSDYFQRKYDNVIKRG